MSLASLRVLYEDARLVAVDKPCGQTVIPGRGTLDSEPLVLQASRHINGKAFVVHRLDRETSGIVLFAKNAAVHRTFCSLFESRQIKKVYLALVQGVIESAGTINKPLQIFGSGRTGVDPEGKPSITRYQAKQTLRGATLLEVEPLTGRRHQIRAHLHSIGHPILGDKRYGTPKTVSLPRLMLHAQEVAFHLEGSGQIRIRCEPPPDFLDILERAKQEKKQG